MQFHPEVLHTVHGTEILKNFLYKICGLAPEWSMANYVSEAIEEVRAKVGGGKVLLALSGGVDSSVAAALLYRAVGEQLTCIFVDHGLLRKDEGDRGRGAPCTTAWTCNFVRVNARASVSSRKLAGVSEPERKRKIIGEEFIRVFEAEAKKIGTRRFSRAGHHLSRRGRIRRRRREPPSSRATTTSAVCPTMWTSRRSSSRCAVLFKDEVRQLGLELGLPE